MGEQKCDSFAKFAWFAVAFNIIVIVWGVFLRASYSGDGCGQHWLTCGGEMIPSAPQLKTVIEFSHRISTSLAGIVVFILVCWSFARVAKRPYSRLFAVLSFVFILIEGAIGGGLVLTGNTAANWTPTRPYWTAGHLINTFILLAFLSLAAFTSIRPRFFERGDRKTAVPLVIVGIFTIFFIGITGSMAALSTMLFPVASIAEGIASDFDPASHPLLRLRILHPIAAIIGSAGIFFIASWVRVRSENRGAQKWSRMLSVLILVQLGFGALTLLTLGPILMQLGHLLIADLVWIAFVLMFANYFTTQELA